MLVWTILCSIMFAIKRTINKHSARLTILTDIAFWCEYKRVDDTVSFRKLVSYGC